MANKKAGNKLPITPDTKSKKYNLLGVFFNDFIDNGSRNKKVITILNIPTSLPVKYSSDFFIKINELPHTKTRTESISHDINALGFFIHYSLMLFKKGKNIKPQNIFTLRTTDTKNKLSLQVINYLTEKIMEKKIFTFFLLLFTAVGLNAQIFSYDFEGYTVGQPLAQQAGMPWTTWSNQPGGSEDPLISDAQAQQGSKSFVVSGTNDGVLLFGDSTSGRYKIDFYIYVPAGKLGYYNLLATFAGANSEWGTQLFFDVNGEGRIDAGKEGAATFNFNYDQWIHLEHYIDLDNDWAEVFIDGQYLYDWQWTAGATGTPVPKRLAAADFYAWEGTSRGTPEAYYDNLVYAVCPLPAAPSNLTATLNDTIVSLQWDAPSSGTPDSYMVYRNGSMYAVTTTTSFSDSLEYPGNYTYDVKAYYSASGLSPFAGSVNVLLPGGVDRNYVLVEIGTGTGCPYCPGAAMGADDMIANGDPVAVIEYHNYNSSDPFNNPESEARTAFYGINAYPTAYFDGGDEVRGGSHNQSLYPTYHPIVINRADQSSIFNIDMTAQMVSGNDTTFDVSIDVTRTYNYTATNTKLFLALTETHIPYNWQGQHEINNTCRAMYPDANGTAGTFGYNTPEHFDFTISIPDDYIVSNCNLIAFVQDVDTKEVFQTEMVNLGQVVSIKEQGENYARVYPNPASDKVNLETIENIKHVTLLNVGGQRIYDAVLDANHVSLNTSSFDKGVYFLKIETEKGKIIKKLIIE
jgi:hypothetical protein